MHYFNNFFKLYKVLKITRTNFSLTNATSVRFKALDKFSGWPFNLKFCRNLKLEIYCKKPRNLNSFNTLNNEVCI